MRKSVRHPRPAQTLITVISFFPEKVCDEITKVVGLAQPRIAHRTQMPYTDAVIHEVQRFANILPTSLPHVTTTNVTFKNYYIPKVRAQKRKVKGESVRWLQSQMH